MPSNFQNGFSYARQTTNLIINLDHDEWIIDDDDKILADLGFGEMCCATQLAPPHPFPRERNRSEPVQSQVV